MSANQDWKERAEAFQKNCIDSFYGSPFFSYNESQYDSLLLRICCSMYGLPTEYTGENFSTQSYNADQRKEAEKITNAILQVHKSSSHADVIIGASLIYCKTQTHEAQRVVFSINMGKDKEGKEIRHFVDDQCRTYTSWEDWKSNNSLPEMEYAYPNNGSYFGDSKIEFGKSPACSEVSQLFKFADTVSSLASMCSGLIGALSFFTPIGPAVMAVTATANAWNTGYGLMRGVGCIIDKTQHGEQILTSENLPLLLNVIGTPLGIASSKLNSHIVKGAQNGRTFTRFQRSLLTALNFSKFGIDSGMMATTFANLINKKELTTKDYMQFTTSLFFFTNTLIQPKVASTIIKLAQEKHLANFCDSLQDEKAKKSFNALVAKKGGNMEGNAHIIRTLKNIENPEQFFKCSENFESTPGGRKGKTMLLEDTNRNDIRMNPNRVKLSKESINKDQPSSFNKDFKRLKKCYGKDPKEIVLNGEKIFENMSEQDVSRVGKVFNGAAKCDPAIIQTSHKIAESMGLKTADDLMNVVEIVVAEVKGKCGAELAKSLNNIVGSGKDAFIERIRHMENCAAKNAVSGALSFGSPLSAVYHYLKHHEDFSKKFKKHGNGIEVYLGQIKNSLFIDENLKEIFNFKNGNVRRLYANKNDFFGVLTNTKSGSKISTMYKKPGCNEAFLNEIKEYLKDPRDLSKAENLGKSFDVFIHENESKTLWTKDTKVDDCLKEEILLCLCIANFVTCLSAVFKII